ncbi:MAG: ExbD/TolR family protein [Planctomycetota bacterium]|jgi:biopolymer transport protein ExbD
MKLYRKVHKKDLDVNIAPLIDVILLLIIFFMTVSQITKTEAEPLNLPEAERAKDIEKEENKRVIITVRQNGGLSVLGQTQTLEQVRGLLKEEKARRDAADIRVLIRGDANAEWQSIEKIVALCRDEGLLRVRVAVTKKD